ncbi:methyl-accepting chemotaxis protein [Paenibacillus sp. JX-17]|uniref:Methyl-accepting chemotaxis protein n=1 Tax=Paenibacillus lacisoli TaxID=3064525 RepID=A0ABT9CHU1_9BACL|nr:methyl-accepting chemotaxis protein [Paenibacillus sp. JX-17]MDO7908199.1 methyl-accepting chemotaxis protein [Paenibacillus sp. JX-17]
MSDIVSSVIAAMPLIREVVREDASLSVLDHEKFLYYSPIPGMEMGFEVGSPLMEADRDFKNLKNGREKNLVHFPEDMFGTPFDCLFIPIKNEEDQVVASLCVMYSMKNQNMLSRLMVNAKEITAELLDGIQHVAAHSEELSSTTEGILVNTRQAVDNSKSVTQVAALIREISDQTNLLGLNAAIEAARVGEAGAGFDVVAKEVRKLSVDTKKATATIEESLHSVQDSIRALELEIGEIATFSHEQAQLVSQFMEAIERLNKTNQTMADFIKKVITYEA